MKKVHTASLQNIFQPKKSCPFKHGSQDGFSLEPVTRDNMLAEKIDYKTSPDAAAKQTLDTLWWPGYKVSQPKSSQPLAKQKNHWLDLPERPAWTFCRRRPCASGFQLGQVRSRCPTSVEVPWKEIKVVGSWVRLLFSRKLGYVQNENWNEGREKKNAARGIDGLKYAIKLSERKGEKGTVTFVFEEPGLEPIIFSV